MALDRCRIYGRILAIFLNTKSNSNFKKYLLQSDFYEPLIKELRHTDSRVHCRLVGLSTLLILYFRFDKSVVG